MPEIKIDGKALNNVDSFTYLGSSLPSSNSLDEEVCEGFNVDSLSFVFIISVPVCSRLCASDYGLRSHTRVHK